MTLADQLDPDSRRRLLDLARPKASVPRASTVTRAPASPPPRVVRAVGVKRQESSSKRLSSEFMRMTTRRRSFMSVLGDGRWLRVDVLRKGHRVSLSLTKDLEPRLEASLNRGCSCVRRPRCSAHPVRPQEGQIVVETRCGKGREALFAEIARSWPELATSQVRFTLGPTLLIGRESGDSAKDEKRRREGNDRAQRNSHSKPLAAVVTPINRPLDAERLERLSRQTAPPKALDPSRPFGSIHWHDTRTSEE